MKHESEEVGDRVARNAAVNENPGDVAVGSLLLHQGVECLELKFPKRALELRTGDPGAEPRHTKVSPEPCQPAPIASALPNEIHSVKSRIVSSEVVKEYTAVGTNVSHHALYAIVKVSLEIELANEAMPGKPLAQIALHVEAQGNRRCSRSFHAYHL
jgi:hypothetical protein